MGREYTYSELMAMQEEATQRVREMQRRAQLTAQRAQEELDRKKPTSSPAEQPTEKAKPASEWTAPQEKHEADADRFSFLDSEPQRPQPPAGKTHSPKHISLPVDFIQEKREAPAPAREGETCAVQEAPQDTEAPARPAPDRKSPLPLGLTEGESDRSLLLALMLLLNGEGADELLLLSLLYIMM